MAPSSSSTRKAARLAQKGKGRRIRFQGGTLFPLVVAIILVVGLSLVVYARASRPENVAPFDTDHWHGAYAFQLCSDAPNVEFSGNLEEFDQATGGLIGSQQYITSGVHSHDDGVIHWHPIGSRALGNDATLGVFFDNYDVDISNDRLELPEGSFTVDGGPPPADYPTVYEEGETECDGEDATLKVVVWDDADDPNSDQTYTSSFGDIRFDRDGMAFTIAYVPDDVDVEMPPSAANLAALGAADAPPQDPNDPEDTTPEATAPGSTEPGTTEPDGSEPETTVADSSPTTEAGAADTEPATTAAEGTATTAATETTTGGSNAGDG